MPDLSDYTAFIARPQDLKPGSIVVRYKVAGEVLPIPQRWVVLEWKKPSRPRPGEAWASGFLRCENEATEARFSFGPASLIRSDFRVIPPHVLKDDPSPVTKLNQRFWYEKY
jgi:hypothetical protein